jgi:hypothetical protein
MKKIPQCDQVTKINGLSELEALSRTFNAITWLTFQHDDSQAGISAIGGVEAVFKTMITFPNCQSLQDIACCTLRNVLCKNVTGKKKAIESGGIEVTLAAINNPLASAILCEHACEALYNIANGSRENTVLLLSLGGGAAVTNVKAKWPDDGKVQTALKSLTQLIVAEMSSWL